MVQVNELKKNWVIFHGLVVKYLLLGFYVGLLPLCRSLIQTNYQGRLVNPVELGSYRIDWQVVCL